MVKRILYKSLSIIIVFGVISTLVPLPGFSQDVPATKAEPEKTAKDENQEKLPSIIPVAEIPLKAQKVNVELNKIQTMIHPDSSVIRIEANLKTWAPIWSVFSMSSRCEISTRFPTGRSFL
ncbi:MAG: hypothetical protein PVH84_08450 [Candidatus Aminicenantes bacterium]|jgi:hypothetical protein